MNAHTVTERTTVQRVYDYLEEHNYKATYSKVLRYQPLPSWSCCSAAEIAAELGMSIYETSIALSALALMGAIVEIRPAGGGNPRTYRLVWRP